MDRTVDKWFSPSLNKEMEIAVYGHYGLALLMIPTAASGYLEYEENGLINSLKNQIDEGKVKVFCINSINNESWLNPYMSGFEQGVRHEAFNDYVYKEVVPYIKNATSKENMIITCGASFGALHAANLFFKQPDLIHGIIGLSGCYDLTEYTNGFYDNNVYFNSPVHYLPNLKAEWHLNQCRQSRHIHFVTGSGEYERPDYSRQISGILNSKNIPHELDIWGADMPHEWWVWHQMLPHFIDTRF